MARTNRTFTAIDRQQHLEAQPESGLTIAEYCQQNDLALSTFDNWKQKARRKRGTELPFVELPLPKIQREFEIRCGNFSLTIPDNVDVEPLTKLLTAMNRAVS